MADKLPWGRMLPDGWKELPMEPILAAGWVEPYFWLERPDGSVLWVIPEPEEG